MVLVSLPSIKQNSQLTITVCRATEIDSRVGCVLDGAIVYYEDGHETPCGPRTNSHNGGKHYFGQSTRSQILSTCFG